MLCHISELVAREVRASLSVSYAPPAFRFESEGIVTLHSRRQSHSTLEGCVRSDRLLRTEHSTVFGQINYLTNGCTSLVITDIKKLVSFVFLPS